MLWCSVEVDVDNQYIAISALWTLTTPVPWDVLGHFFSNGFLDPSRAMKIHCIFKCQCVDINFCAWMVCGIALQGLPLERRLMTIPFCHKVG
jgi:hypothetical protein